MNAKTSVLAVAGLSCHSCVRHIEQALRGVSGVTSVEVRLRDGEVLVNHAPAASLDAMVEALRDAGYESAPAAA